MTYPWTSLRRPSAEEVVALVALRDAIPRDPLLRPGRRKAMEPYRQKIAYLMQTECGMSLAEIAAYLGRGRSTIHRWVVRHQQRP